MNLVGANNGIYPPEYGIFNYDINHISYEVQQYTRYYFALTTGYENETI